MGILRFLQRCVVILPFAIPVDPPMGANDGRCGIPRNDLPANADCRGGVFATRRFPRPIPPACVFPPILEWPPIVTINRDAAHRVVTLPFAVSHLCPSGRKWRSVPRCYPIANPPCAYAHPPQPSTKWVRPIGRTHFLGRMESLSVQLWPLSPPWPLGATSPPRRPHGPVYHL